MNCLQNQQIFKKVKESAINSSEPEISLRESSVLPFEDIEEIQI